MKKRMMPLILCILLGMASCKSTRTERMQEREARKRERTEKEAAEKKAAAMPPRAEQKQAPTSPDNIKSAPRKLENK